MMTILSKAGALAVAGFFVATSAMASTVDITASDVRGDRVKFTVTNNVGTGQCSGDSHCISSILFDLTASKGETNATFNGGVRKLNGRGLDRRTITHSILDTPDANGERDNSTRNALQFNFADKDFDPGNVLRFHTWVRGLTNGGGLGSDGAELFAEVTLESGASASGFFTSNASGRASLSLDFGPVSEVPLPASALLLIGGLAGLGAMRRRKTS